VPTALTIAVYGVSTMYGPLHIYSDICGFVNTICYLYSFVCYLQDFLPFASKALVQTRIMYTLKLVVRSLSAHSNLKWSMSGSGSGGYCQK